MKNRFVTTAMLATFALSVPFATATAAEMTLKAGFFISTNKFIFCFYKWVIIIIFIFFVKSIHISC